MELRHLRYFVTVASELHFARAAQRLFISQPALSQQIRSLEGELGLKLLERNRRGVRLTPEGAAFLVEARAVVQQADHAADVARALAEGATGQLRMAHLRTMFSGPPELIVREYERRFPGVELTSDSGTTASNVERLRNGELDVAFVLTPIESAADLGCVEIATEPIVVALPSGHPLSRRRRVRREELAGVPLVFFPRHYSPGYYDRCLSQVYGSATTPNIVRTEPSEERTLVGVSERAGISLILAERAATLRYPGVVYRRFPEPEPTGALGVAFRRPPSLAARRLIDLAREMAHQPKTANHPHAGRRPS
ncbi:MAG TPA: LysR substrate-binding domain-containing protein [Chloroflexota bacterium]|jgi:DNA-binding transcriptional LysR family regulator